MNTKEFRNTLVLSYLTLRRLIGVLGILLPFVLVIGLAINHHYTSNINDYLQTSISQYYHTPMRDFFVAISIAMGLFQITYKGYSTRDNVLTNIAGVSGIILSLIPTSVEVPNLNMNLIFFQSDLWIKNIHFLSAASFFLVNAFIFIKIFTISTKEVKTLKKIQRNKVYKICGYSIILFIILMGIVFLFGLNKRSNPMKYSIIFLETLSLISFGVSWLIKGETLLKDEDTNTNEALNL